MNRHAITWILTILMVAPPVWSREESPLYAAEETTVTLFGLADYSFSEISLGAPPLLDAPAEMTIPEGAEIDVLETGTSEEGQEYVRIVINGSLAAWVSADEMNEVETLEETLVAGGSGSFIVPTKGRITSRPGMRRHPILKRRKFHAGTDIAAPRGTPVNAAASGKVLRSGWAGSYGILIELLHSGGVKTRYAHLSKTHVKNNQRVNQGQLIGRVGSTGRSTGNHLHFERR